MTAHWRRCPVGVELLVDGAVAVTIAKNGKEWRAWGDVPCSYWEREKVVARVLEACREAGVTVTNACPEE